MNYTREELRKHYIPLKELDIEAIKAQHSYSGPIKLTIDLHGPHHRAPTEHYQLIKEAMCVSGQRAEMIFGVELHKVDKLSNEWKDSPFWTGTVSAEGVNKINWNDINCVTMMYVKPDTIHFTTKVSLTSAGEPVNRHFEFLLLLQTIEFLPYIGVFNDQAGQTTIFIITPDEAREILANIEPEATKPNCSNRGVCTCILNAVETKKVVLFTSDDVFNGDHVKLFSDPDDRDHLLKISFNKTQAKKFPRWEGGFCCDRRAPVMADIQKIEKMRCFFDLLFY